MQYPNFQVPYLGNGMAIPLDAVLHVLISHGVAIGVFALIVWSEYRGYRKRSEAWNNFAGDLLKVVIIVITSVGAITGVGIWFFIATLEPRGTGALLRIFFWPWFIEWFVFTAEVIVLLVYYFTWDRWTGPRKKRHILLGVGYTLLAIISGFLITGILGFMLTVDEWPWQQSYWLAFFNPSFLPQLLLRLGGAFTLGAILTLAFLLFTDREPEFRREALPLFGGVGLAALVLTAVSSWWYFAVVPSTFKAHALFSVLTSHLSQQPQIFWLVNGAAALFLVGLAGVAIGRRVSLTRVMVIPAIILAVLFFIEFERIREFIRGPYVIPGYMYANEVLLKEGPFFSQHGMLPNNYWYTQATRRPNVANQGAYLFAENCSTCHTIGGINDIVGRVAPRTENGILVLIRHTDEMVPFMPPFSGTPQEQRILASYLFQLARGDIEAQAPSRFVGVD